MPRYFFHLLDEYTDDLMKDSVGCALCDTGQARKEAIGLARDIATHGLQGRRWKIIVMDDDGVVLTLSQADIKPRRTKPWLALAHRIATYTPGLRPHVFAWLLTGLIFALVMQAAVTTRVSRQNAEITGSVER